MIGWIRSDPLDERMDVSKKTLNFPVVFRICEWVKQEEHIEL